MLFSFVFSAFFAVNNLSIYGRVICRVFGYAEVSKPSGMIEGQAQKGQG
jgi:hypothetical protein